MGTFDDELKLDFEIRVPDQRLLGEDSGNMTFQLVPYVPKTDDVGEVIEATFSEDVSEADKWDYMVAASSGVLMAALDMLWIGEFSLTSVTTWGTEKLGGFALKAAKIAGYKGNDPEKAMQKLQHDFQQAQAGSGRDLRGELMELEHYPTIAGLLFSILSQFSGKSYFVDPNGKLTTRVLPEDKYMGRNFPEKIFCGVLSWAFHLVLNRTVSNIKGNGIPSKIMSFLAELSSLPLVRDIQYRYKDSDEAVMQWLTERLDSKEGANGPFDLRSEIGLDFDVPQEKMPLAINECIIRSFYFMRRLFLEVRAENVTTIEELNAIDPERYLPRNNRTIARMNTISSGTFSVVETAGAAVMAVVRNKGLHIQTAVDFVVSLNYAGLGQFLIACRTDSKYIAKDFQKLYRDLAERPKKEKTENVRTIPGFKLLPTNAKQTRLIRSLERQKILYDISQTSNMKQQMAKMDWQERWESGILSKNAGDGEYFIRDENMLYDYIRFDVSDDEEQGWIWLAALELALFTPYYPLYSERDKDFRNLRLKSDYEKDCFTVLQDEVSAEDLESLLKSYRQYIGKLNDGVRNAASGAALVAVTLAAGGLNLVVPHVAGMVSKGQVTPFSAARSFSMMNLALSKEFALSECAKLLTYCHDVLLMRMNAPDPVRLILHNLGNGIRYLEREVVMLERLIKNKEADETQKRIAKEATVSLKYLERCETQIEKMLEEEENGK